MKDYTVSVITYDYTKKQCQHCGHKQMICFNSQCFTEELRPIITACKECIIKRAGGPEKVYVKIGTGQCVRDIWNAEP